MRFVRIGVLGGVLAGSALAGSGTNSLLQSPPSTGAPSPSRPSAAAAPPRLEWSDPRSLLDSSRPPTASSGSTPRALENWQRRDLPQLDEMRHEMELRNQPDFNRKFIDDLDWYFARQKQQEMQAEPLPKPPGPPESRPDIGDVTPFDLAAPSTQPTTRPGE